MGSITPQPSTIPAARIGWLGIAGTITGVLLGVVNALVWSKGFISAEVAGYATAAISTQWLIAYAIAGRASKRDWNKFGFWFTAISFLFLLLELNSRR